MDASLPEWIAMPDLFFSALAHMLDARSVLRLVCCSLLYRTFQNPQASFFAQACTSQRMNELMRDDSIWEHLSNSKYTKWDNMHLRHMVSVRDDPGWLS
jgi:hypothetical protein